MSRYRLYLGPQDIEVDLLDDSKVALNTQLKDYESLNVRKGDYIANIQVVKNSKADVIMPSYFHVNSTFDPTNGLKASLTHDGVTIMKGMFYPTKVENEYFTGDMVSNAAAIALMLKDKLIYGNPIQTDDLHIDPNSVSDYHILMTRSNVRQYLNAGNKSRDFAFPMVNYDGYGATNTDKNEYPLYPAINFRVLIESILKETGIEYSIEQAILDDMNRMYVPYNGNPADLAGNSSMELIKFQAQTIELPKLGDEFRYANDTTHLGHVNSIVGLKQLNVDSITLRDPTTQVWYGKYTIPADGSYTFKFNPYGKLQDHVSLVDEKGFAKPYYLKYSIAHLRKGGTAADWKLIHFPPIKLTNKTLALLETETITIEGLTEGDWVAIVQDDARYVDGKEVPLDFQMFEPYNTPAGTTMHNVWEIWASNYLYSGANLTLNDILPRNYSKFDAVKDFMNMYNISMTESEGGDMVSFTRYGLFADTTKPTIDITSKVDTSKITIESLSATVPSTLSYEYTEAEDKLSEDFFDKYDEPFGSYNKTTEGRLNKNTEVIYISTGSTVIMHDRDYNFSYAHIIKESKTIENLPRILYLNVQAVNYLPDARWGADRRSLDASITNMFYLSTEDDELKNSLNFSNEYTYDPKNTEMTNRTLYNRFHREEADYILDPVTKRVTLTCVIKGLHLEEAYKRRLYYLDLGPKGTFYGIINKLSGYDPNSGKGKFEFITLPNDPTYGTYNDKINPKLVVYTPKSESDKLTNYGGSISSTSGVTGDYFTKDYINTHFMPLDGGIISGSLQVTDDVTINGDLRVLGTGTTVDLQTLEIESNEIILNHGLNSAAAPYNGLSGVRVNRGNQEDYLFQFQENTGLFKIGKASRLQAVATRQDDPIDNTIPYWSRAQRMYMSSGITYQNGTFVDNAGNYFYNSSNSNKEYIPWHAQKMLVGNGTLMEGLIQAKHLNGSYGTILSIDGARRALIGKSGVTQGVALFNGTTEVARTFSEGMIFPRNIDVDGEAKASLFYTGQVENLNDIKTDVYRGLEVMRYSQGAANKPIDSNNANGLLNIYSHGTGYGKQIAFGDSDDLYIRRMTAGSFGGWKKLYHSGNANTEDSFWKAKFMRVYDQQVIRGSAANDRLQLWGSAPYMSFWDEASDNRWAYIQANSGNLLLDVAGINNSLDFRVGGFKRGSVGKWGFGVESGSIYRCFGKHGTSWNNYNYADTTRMGALDVQLVNDASASWIWSVRDHSNTFKAGFQTSNNSNYSQLHLTRRLKVTAWDNVFQFYADGVKIAQLDKDGNLRVKGTVQAHAI